MKKPIITLSSALQSTGLGSFLMVGFNGCTSDECKNKDLLPQAKLEECNKHYSGGSAHSTSISFLPFFIHSSSGTSSSTSSGYFSPSQSSHSSSESSGG